MWFSVLREKEDISERGGKQTELLVKIGPFETDISQNWTFRAQTTIDTVEDHRAEVVVVGNEIKVHSASLVIKQKSWLCQLCNFASFR